jgi:uncharacterized membrane protein YesL
VASRADDVALAAGAVEPGASLPSAPTLRGAVRAALADLYYHSWRLVPANVVWAVVAILVAFVAILVPVGFVALPVLAIPTAGLFRMATRIARGRAVSFSDALDAWRTEVGTTLLLGGALALAAIALSVNVATGVLSDTIAGWAFATLAFWGLVVGWLYAWTAWPLVTDPARASWPARERLRLAGLLVLAHPLRIGALALGLAAFLALSTVAIVALLTVSVAVAAVVAARYVLPAADRLDARLGFAAARGLDDVDAPDDELLED